MLDRDAIKFHIGIFILNGLAILSKLLRYMPSGLLLRFYINSYYTAQINMYYKIDYIILNEI